jgi:uncharacterized protein YunC (DUF1805 family)
MQQIILEGKEFQGIKIPTQNSAILVIKAKNGFLGCGYINVEAADKLGDAVAIVTGVKDFHDMLNAKVIKISKRAEGLGIKKGISGKQALIKLS